MFGHEKELGVVQRQQQQIAELQARNNLLESLQVGGHVVTIAEEIIAGVDARLQSDFDSRDPSAYSGSTILDDAYDTAISQGVSKYTASKLDRLNPDKQIELAKAHLARASNYLTETCM